MSAGIDGIRVAEMRFTAIAAGAVASRWSEDLRLRPRGTTAGPARVSANHSRRRAKCHRG